MTLLVGGGGGAVLKETLALFVVPHTLRTVFFFSEFFTSQTPCLPGREAQRTRTSILCVSVYLLEPKSKLSVDTHREEGGKKTLMDFVQTLKVQKILRSEMLI